MESTDPHTNPHTDPQSDSMNHNPEIESANPQLDCMNQNPELQLEMLQNLSKHKSSIQKNKTLIKSIENKDLSFIQEFLSSKFNLQEISNLSKFYKCRLLPLLIELIDQPQRIEAIKCIYEIMNDIGNVEVFSKILLERSVDFNKLVFLKGKIDYLKYMQKNKKGMIEDLPENEYNE